jgi:formate dehydrogenase major subunit
MEAHPVGSRWAMKARERGARIIHVDPHYSRTSAAADLHVPIRAGSDIAFLGGLIHHIIETESYFKDYVVNYTNASMLVHEDFRDTEDLDGLFSGFDRETGTYDRSTWMFEGGDPDQVAGEEEQATQAFTDRTGGQDTTDIPRDPTLQHPRCVFQVLRRHYSRYTPEMVEQLCGVPPELFREVADTLIANSGRERTTMLAYAVGWTQHTAGV